MTGKHLSEIKCFISSDIVFAQQVQNNESCAGIIWQCKDLQELQGLEVGFY